MNRTMKILTYITSIDLTGGGPSRSVLMLVKGMADLGTDVTLMTQRSEKINTHALDGLRRNCISLMLSIARILRHLYVRRIST